VIPVDLRNDITSPKQSTRLGCKVASVLATVPSGMESAIPRLWATRHRLEELKASADSVVAYGATAILMNILPHRLAIPILESITNKVINTCAKKYQINKIHKSVHAQTSKVVADYKY